MIFSIHPAILKAITKDFSGHCHLKSSPDGSQDVCTLAGKSVIITEATGGLGEALMRSYVQHGAFVTFGGRSEDEGNALMSELGADKVHFVRCDVTSWADQPHLFKTALAKSPSKTIDVVVASAGVGGKHDLTEDKLTEDGDPDEPNLATLNVDLIGATYTAKLALHYLSKQPEGPGRDRCLILVASIAAYVSKQGSPQYNAAEWGVRGLFRNLRTTWPQHNMRVNLLTPWFTGAQTNTPEMYQHLEDIGASLAGESDAARAVMYLSSDTTLYGRAICVIPKEWNDSCCVDLMEDCNALDNPVTHWEEFVNKI